MALEVPKDSALVFEHHEPLPSARTAIVVRLNGYVSHYGERVIVLGDAPELGCWDPMRGVALYYANPNLWTGDLLFNESAGKEVLYRFAVIDASGSIRHEDCLPRQRRVPEHGVLSWKERWQG
jgi:hypothetical protein